MSITVLSLCPLPVDKVPCVQGSSKIIRSTMCTVDPSILLSYSQMWWTFIYVGMNEYTGNHTHGRTRMQTNTEWVIPWFARCTNTYFPSSLEISYYLRLDTTVVSVHLKVTVASNRLVTRTFFSLLVNVWHIRNGVYFLWLDQWRHTWPDWLIRK